jgi:hypothetical protein
MMMKPDIRSVSDRVAAAASPPAETVVELSRPLATHKGEVRKIVLRQPHLSDYIEIGDIDCVAAAGVDESTGQPRSMEVKTNREALISWAVRLSGLDRTILGTLAPEDSGALIQAVRIAILPFSRGNSPSGPTS